MTFTLLSSLRARERNAVIRVRVCRKWDFRAGGTDDGSIIHVDLVLVDEKGDSIYAEIPTTEIKRKAHLVEEGGVYIISRFIVSNAKHTFMPVPGNYMIEFTFHTMVKPVVDVALDIPKLVYHLTPFSDLDQRIGVHSHFTDVIGVLVEVSDSRPVHLTGRPNPTFTRDIVLRDLSYFEVRVSMWGHRASSFDIDTVYDPDDPKPIVMLLVGTVVKTYEGQHYLSAGAACRWHFSPSIPEAHMFYSSLNDQRIEIRWPATAASQPRGPALSQAQMITLAELNATDTYVIGNNCHRCTVVIDRLVPGERWWFPSCTRCNKSSMPEGSGFKCRICHSTHYKFKYKIAFVAKDGNAEAQMVAFDHVATRIVGKPIHQLMRAGKPIQDFPPDIAAVAALKFTFAIALSDQSFRDAEKSYRVLAVLATHGRQTSVPLSVLTASSSKVQTNPTNLEQQQPALEGGISQTPGEIEVPEDSTAQPAATIFPQTTPDTINATPPDKKQPTSTRKRDSTSNLEGKNKRPTARRELSLDMEEPPEGTTTSAPGTKKARGQKKSASIQIKEPLSQEHK